MKKLFPAVMVFSLLVFTANGWGATLDPITFVHPAPGEIIHPSTVIDYVIEWSTPNPDAVLFKLYYSMDNGETWRPAPGGKVPGSTYPIKVLAPDSGNKWIKLKIYGYNNAGVKVAKGISERTYLEIIKIISPDLAAGPFQGGQPGSISWHLWEPVDPVQRVKLFYTVNGGRTWKRIASLGPPYTSNETIYTYTDFTWPAVNGQKTNCKVKVVIVDDRGFNMGKDVSDEVFIINP